jgi:predicted hexulose-6-phosphate isomerase
MCLSGHRRYPLGSASPAIRRRALDIFENAIEFAFDIGIRIIQVAGYDVYYEPRDAGSCARYADGLHQGADWASQAGIMLGLENVDSENLDSLVKGMEFVHGINSPWLHLYPDIGNLVAMGYDPVSEIEVAVGHLVGVHIKDTILGQVRRIPFGGGIVPFAECFRKLNAINFCGPMVIEMWCDERPDAFDTVVQARRWIEDIQEHARPGG